MKTKIETPESSNIQTLEYNSQTKELLVTFKKGGIYKYKDVPQEAFTMVTQADSVGSAFYSLVKSGGYTYEKVGDLNDTMTI